MDIKETMLATDWGYPMFPIISLNKIGAFVQVASARLTLRTSDAVNDTALHVAAYSYDWEGLLALLLRDGGGGQNVNTPDSLGRTALHYAADVTDQLAALVNVFAEPEPTVVPVLEQRTSQPQCGGGGGGGAGASSAGKATTMRMAADHSQAAVTEVRAAAQPASAQPRCRFRR
eukprot:COSAG01_NODE_1031_length_12014_cov_27.936131_2_plen_174_part_00